MKRLLPDFYRAAQRATRRAPARPRASTVRCAACTSRPSSTPNAKRDNGLLDTLPRAAASSNCPRTTPTPGSAAVNDVRLALGTMLDIGADGPDELPPDHPMAGHLDVYQWLTVLQEYLVLALIGKRRDEPVRSPTSAASWSAITTTRRRTRRWVPAGPPGTTVVLAPPGTVGAVDGRGGAPGTRETDLLDPINTVRHVDAVVLTGGSAYGLAAADGVMTLAGGSTAAGSRWTAAVVPIVPAAVIFDLPVGGWG